MTGLDSSDGSAGGPSHQPLVVGIGASAGGINALQNFFARVPPDSAAAYVVILHLSPDHESRLASILQQIAAIPVNQVRERTPIEANHVYVVPPNKVFEVDGGHLTVHDMTRPEQRRSPVDAFFRALADAYRSRAVAVVLSGTGPNGSSGIKRIKEYAGLAIAQDPAEAEYGDMPRNSIATGLVDYVLPVAAIPDHVIRFGQRVPAETEAADPAVDPMHEVLALLRARTGNDFSNYKPSTLLRRLDRRLTIKGIDSIAAYVGMLRTQPDEAHALLRDLLVSVTNFFRDAAAWRVLEDRIIPRLFVNRGLGGQIRAWSAGCASGEEAYSIAMLLVEHASRLSDAPAVQVFATDLDQQAIATAREALYSDAEVADVPEARLQRFFQHEAGGYRVRRELRELVLFAHHNVIKDPPFSHLDLISCRNLLIYLNRPIQEKVIATFHFALRPDRYLFLGTSESPDGQDHLFDPIDKSAHIYQNRGVIGRLAIPLDDAPISGAARLPRLAAEPRTEPVMPADTHQRLLEQYAPPSLVATEDHTIVHVSEGATRYLRVPPGEPSRDLVKLIHDDLRVELQSALHQASETRREVRVRGVRVASPDAVNIVDVTVRPVFRDRATAQGFFLVLFDQIGVSDADAARAIEIRSTSDPAAPHLAEELAHAKTQLMTTVQRYEDQAEVTKSANEELQAMNEELRSAAEELETSREELQSVNEELVTVNQELKVKIDELGLTNNDFRNLMSSIDIGTIFLDRSFRVKLSTPRAKEVFNLLPTDVGRPLSDITSKLAYDNLLVEVADVLQSLQTVEREVQTRDGKWYLMRILPYRTLDDRIDGVVITFSDISVRREAELKARRSEERVQLLIDSAIDYAIFTMTVAGVIDSWNAGAERMFGYAADEAIGQSAAILFTAEDRSSGVFEEELRRARDVGRAEDERYHVRKDGTPFYCSGVTSRLGGGDSLGFAKIARDLTRQRSADLALQHAHAELEQRVVDRTAELRAEVARRARAQSEVASLLGQIVTAQEDERARIARDLHDQLGQQLVGLRMVIERHQKGCATQPGAEDLDKALALTSALDSQLDFLAWQLRPAALDDLGLASALPRFVSEWSAHHGIPAETAGGGVVPGVLTRDAEVAFYRIAQEALNNVVKHAHASQVDVVLEARDGAVVLIVEDNGIGFDLAAQAADQKGIGLVGMRERAALINAVVDIESTPGNGTTVFVRCPMERRTTP